MDDARGVRGVIDEGRGNEEAVFVGFFEIVGGGVAAEDGVQGVFFDVGEVGLDFFVLGGVLEGADVGVVVGAGAEFEVFGVGNEGGEEAGVDGGVDVDAFDGHADLAGVDEGELGDL